jgi:hypothetical protein
VDRGLTTHHSKKQRVPKYSIVSLTWMDSLVEHKHQKMDVRFGTWNIRSLYRPGALKVVARELEKFKLDLVDIQEVRWEKSGTEQAEDYIFFYEKENEHHHLGTGYFCAQEDHISH